MLSGRAQLVRGVGGEVALNPKALFEPVQRLVDRQYQRPHLARNLLDRQAKAGARRPDLAGDLGGLPQRPQGAAEDRDIGDQQHQQDRQRDPSDILVEIGDDIVDQHVAVGEILAGLDPHGLAADGLPDAGAGHGGVAAPQLQELDIAGSGVGGKQGGVVLQRGKQHPSPIVDHRIGIAPIGLRIEPEQVERKIEFEAAVAARALKCSPTDTACSCIALLWMLSVA